MLNLRMIRKDKSLTQQYIATQTNHTIACISSWETGKTEPCIEDLIQLASVLDVSVDYLIGHTDEFGAVNYYENLTLTQREIIKLSKNLSLDRQYQVLGFIKALYSESTV